MKKNTQMKMKKKSIEGKKYLNQSINTNFFAHARIIILYNAF